MDNPFKLFVKITSYLEGFTHIVPVPMAVYFTMAVGAFKSEKEALAILISGGICGIIMLSLGTLLRYYRLKRVSEEFNKNNNTEDKYKKLKISLLNQPFFEAKIIAARWLIGVPFAHGIYVIGWGVEFDLHRSIPFVMMFTAPISYIAHLFITERIIEQELKKEEFKNVYVDLNDTKILKMSYFLRIIASLFSIVSMPFILLGYFLYASYSGYVNLANPLPHIGVLGISTFIPLLITAIYLASSMRKGLNEVEETISELANGNFNRYLPVVSTNEFARQANHINSVIQSLKDMYTRLKDLNENLEKKVEERTNELQFSLNVVKELKYQQDGDYFLTSLLLKPFIKAKVKSDYLKVEYSIKQKKEFEFNEKIYEIGGDLCFSQFIQLKGKEFVLVVNADAMGKSIQGAGGILVLGAVLKSAIERNSIRTGGEDIYPEFWLKNLFKELHRVFVSFEGSMLVSLIIGLIEKDTGLYYYVNAEHPYSILFRDGKASFLENSSHIHKLGFELENREIPIKVLQLLPDDSIIIGSDGKDDIMFTIESKKVINEDEYLFLRTLEETKGDIKEFHKILSLRGDLIDDLSILKFTFLKKVDIDFQANIEPLKSKSIEELEELCTIEKTNMILHSYLAEKLYSKREYKKLISILSPINKIYPYSSENLFMLSQSYFQLNQIETSIEYSERLRTREPYLIKNLILLSEIYSLKGDYKKALSRIEDGLKKDRTSVELLQKKEIIQSKIK